MFIAQDLWESNYSAVTEKNTVEYIIADRFDEIHVADLKESFENCVRVDSKNTLTSPFNFYNLRGVNLAEPVLNSDAVNKGYLNGIVDRYVSPLVYLFKNEWSDHLINHQSWLRADTFSWQPGTTYSDAYNHLVSDIDSKSLQSETVAGVTIQFYLADDGHKICPASEENNVVSIYSATGVAWYYILDTANQQFKLPRTKFGFTGLRDTVGGYVEAGLPNITGSFANGEAEYNRLPIKKVSGAFANAGSSTINAHDIDGGWSGSKLNGVSLDASRSSSIYGNSTTVQPQATQMYLYFYVGQYTQTAIEQTAGLNAELFNGKADLNLSNTASNVDFVVASQTPTAANNYTWYRKYKSGWVEQGGMSVGQSGNTPVSLPIEMSNANYHILAEQQLDFSGDWNANTYIVTSTITATGFSWRSTATSHTNSLYWEVKGFAKE